MNTDKLKTGLWKILEWLLVFVILIITIVFVIRRGQDENYDLLNYHYYSGYAFVHHRFVEDVAPITWHTYLNPLSNVVTFLAYSNIPFPFNSLLLLGLQAISIPAIVLLAREIGKGLGHPQATSAEIVAILLTIAAPLWWSELGTSFYSSTTASLILLALLLLIKGAASSISPRVAFTCTAMGGLLIGLGSALKMTNGFFAVAGMVALVPVAMKERLPLFLKRGLAYVSGLGIGVALLGWWNMKVFREFGNPIYPLYNAIFRSSYYDLVNWHDPRFVFDLIHFIRFPLSAALGTTETSELRFADARYLLCATVAFLAVVQRSFAGPWARERWNQAPAMLLSFVAGGICIWALVFPYQRYLIPIELLLGLATWVLLAYLSVNQRTITIVLVCFLAASWKLVHVPDWGHTIPRSDRPNVFGLQLPSKLTSQPAEYLIAGAPNGFILAFLDPSSHFYRIDFSPKVYGRIEQQLARYPGHPIRLLTMAKEPFPLDDLRNLHLEPTGRCIHFHSDVGAYVSCDLQRIE